MTVAISNTTFSTGTISSLKRTLSVARAAGEGLLIAVWYRGLYGDPYDGISTVKWDPTGDNQSFTLLKLQRQNGTTRYVAVYYLPAPTSAKTGNIEATFVTGNDVDDCAILARHITGHDSAAAARSSLGFEGTISSSTSPETDSISSVSGDLVVDFFSHRYDVGFVGYSAGQNDAALYTSAGSCTLASTTKPGATSVSMGWTSGQTDAEFDYAHVMVSIKPGAATTLAGADTTQGATSGTGVITVTPPTPGVVNLAGSNCSQGATSGTGVVSVTPPAGTISLVGLKNNTATAHASLSGITVYVYSVATGALVVTKTGQTSNASGNMTVTDPLIVAGTTYRCVIVLASSAGEGMARVVAA